MKDYSNYHNTDYSEKFFRDSNERFDKTLAMSPESEMVTVNDSNIKVILTSTSTDPNKRVILFKKDEVSHGDYVEHDDSQWLVVDKPYDNKIYSKSKMALCNESVTVVTQEPESVLVGTDDLGRPRYETSPPVTKELPIVVESKTDQIFDRDEQINLPEGRLIGQIQYDSSLPLDLETEFEIFTDTYRVYNIDLSQVYKGKGVMRLFLEKNN
ncbi:hypothetical protein [Halobacillus litoralis]|uniref:hypothetical protein n=1 Tax=Halobacillus litoralis TaxID=45668 RepID=UPI001CD52DFC|nr:hypothetical protein [Halobacillus litoralis]MCA1021643.1 hypothetical protein [Halobacillus litoralis]